MFEDIMRQINNKNQLSLQQIQKFREQLSSSVEKINNSLKNSTDLSHHMLALTAVNTALMLSEMLDKEEERIKNS